MFAQTTVISSGPLLLTAAEWFHTTAVLVCINFSYIYYNRDKKTFVCLSHATGIGLTLNNVNYTNNSVVTITDIGTGGAALICTTTYTPCCLSTDGSHWYFPDGSRVERTGTTYYRTRTISTVGGGTVHLSRNPGATTTGIFHCDILDASGDLQSIYVGIYTATTGEPCTLKQINNL